MEKTKKQILEEILAHSTGTENYYRYRINGYSYTDGMKEVAEKMGAYWLIDAIFSYRRKEQFQVWTLLVSQTPQRSIKAQLMMQEDKGSPSLVSQKIEFTDFPEGNWKFYLVDGILMVPGEY